jgi:hypothetical protein
MGEDDLKNQQEQSPMNRILSYMHSAGLDSAERSPEFTSLKFNKLFGS